MFEGIKTENHHFLSHRGPGKDWSLAGRAKLQELFSLLLDKVVAIFYQKCRACLVFRVENTVVFLN